MGAVTGVRMLSMGGHGGAEATQAPGSSIYQEGGLLMTRPAPSLSVVGNWQYWKRLVGKMRSLSAAPRSSTAAPLAG